MNWSFLRFILMLPIALGISAAVYAETLAKVGDDKISVRSFRAAARAVDSKSDSVMKDVKLRRQFLEHMINSRLIAQFAREKRHVLSDSAKERLEDIEIQILANDYTDYFVKLKMTEDALKKFYHDNQQLFAKNSDVKGSQSFESARRTVEEKFRANIMKEFVESLRAKTKVSIDEKVFTSLGR